MKRMAVSMALIMVFAAGVCRAEVVFRTEVKETVRGMNVYRMMADDLDHESRLERLLQVLECAGIQVDRKGNIVRSEDFVGFVENGVEAIIDASGSQIVFSDLRGLKLTEKVEALPEDEQAARIALEFLRAGRLVDLERKELMVEHVGGLMQALADPHFNHEPEKKAVAVYFNRVLDGRPVMNKGSHITVMVGDNFMPVNVQYHWREIGTVERSVSESDMVPVRELRERIVKDVSLVRNLDETIVIERIYPVYYDRGENYIQPAYCYEGRVLGRADGAPVLGYVPGLVNPPEPVHHPGHVETAVQMQPPSFPIPPPTPEGIGIRR